MSASGPPLLSPPCCPSPLSLPLPSYLDKASGVSIWDLDYVLNMAVDLKAESSPSSSSSSSSSSLISHRGLLCRLSNHLSAVNVVRWEPSLGNILASGSDLLTQSIILWRQVDRPPPRGSGGARGEAQSQETDQGGGSSQPFGYGRSSSSVRPSSANAGALSSSSVECDYVENWQIDRSLHGRVDIQDLAWAPPNVYFLEEGELEVGDVATRTAGCGILSEASVARRRSQCQGSQVIASCSLDRSVIVWNINNGHQHHLRGHTGWMIGISFDPLGQYLATQSVDGNIWLWSLRDFKLVRKLPAVGLTATGAAPSAPRIDVHRTVAMARMSWTCDGAALVVCRGEMKRKSPSSKLSLNGAPSSSSSSTRPSPISHVSVVLNRMKNFSAQCVFGGHSDRTTVSAFCPLLFTSSRRSVGREKRSVEEMSAGGGRNKEQMGNIFGIVAIGSMDNCLSIWSTRSSSPLLVLTEIWTQSILDLSWSSDGKILLVASHDGSIVAMDFGQEFSLFEGVPLSEGDMEDRIRKLYGTSSTSTPGAQDDTGGLLESPAALALAEAQEKVHKRLQELAEAEIASRKAAAAALAASQAAAAASSVSALTSSSSTSSSPASTSILSLQREVRQPDGRRRIVPVCVAPALDTAPATISAAVASSLPRRTTSSTAPLTTLRTATENVLLQLTGGEGGGGESAQQTQAAPSSSAMTDLFAGAAASAFAAAAKRKRVEISSAAAAAESGAPNTETAEKPRKKHKTAPSSGAAAPSSSSAPSSSVHRDLHDTTVLRAPPRQVRWSVHLHTDQVPNVEGVFRLPQSSGNDFMHKPFSGAARPCTEQIEVNITDVMAGSTSGAASSSSSTANIAHSTTILSAYAAQRNQLWEAYLPARALIVVGNENVLAVASTDKRTGLFQVHLFSSASGRQLASPLLLTAAPFALCMQTVDDNAPLLSSCSASSSSSSSSSAPTPLLVLTCDGLLRVLDVSQPQECKLLVQCSVRHMIKGKIHSKKSAAAAAASSSPPLEETRTIVGVRLSRSLFLLSFSVISNPLFILMPLICGVLYLVRLPIIP